MKKQYISQRVHKGILMMFLWILLLCALVSVGGCGVRQKTIEFKEHLDETVLELDGIKYPLRELAFYVAYEEQLIQEQALVYDMDHTDKYWNKDFERHHNQYHSEEYY